jgi:hypothetical protein
VEDLRCMQHTKPHMRAFIYTHGGPLLSAAQYDYERLEGVTLERMHLTSLLFRIWEMIQAELPWVSSIVAGLLRKSRSVDDDDDRVTASLITVLSWAYSYD